MVCEKCKIDTEEKEKSLYDYKLGEVIDKPLMNGLMQPPNKLVRIGYTYQDKNGTQMEAAIVHDDFKEMEDDG